MTDGSTRVQQPSVKYIITRWTELPLLPSWNNETAPLSLSGLRNYLQKQTSRGTFFPISLTEIQLSTHTTLTQHYINKTT